MLPPLAGPKKRTAADGAIPVFVPSISIRRVALVPSAGPLLFGVAPGCV